MLSQKNMETELQDIQAYDCMLNGALIKHLLDYYLVSFVIFIHMVFFLWVASR